MSESINATAVPFNDASSGNVVSRFSMRSIVTLLVGFSLLMVLCWNGLVHMVGTWLESEVFSHGIIIPFIAAFLVWQKRDVLERTEFRGSWWGILFVLLGIVVHLLGRLATVFALQQYGFLIALFGLVLTVTGWRALRPLAMPMLILLFMVPLPAFFMNNFSAQMQLISSQIGVWVIRLFGISVFLEGNVIDLGVYKLQVAEACDGLRYMFPLMTLAFIMAYFFKVELWKRIVLFLSSIPITILMNSFRIGTIGVMVEYWGVGMAEGFLHEFQGWVVFMASAALMLAEMALLTRIGRVRRPWRQVFGLEFPAPTPAGAKLAVRPQSMALNGSVALLLLCVLTAGLVPERPEVVPQRTTLLTFPQQIGDWAGRRDVMERIYLDTLQLDDYLIADYTRQGSDPVNFYVAWYDSQRSGQSAHSPRSCLPGGGWQIEDLRQVGLDGARVGASPLRVNRVLIADGRNKQLVYYWFQQRGRVITNEYMAKWYLFWDSLTRNRTDGALVRLVSPIRPGESVDAVDERLQRFAALAEPHLGPHIPL